MTTYFVPISLMVLAAFALGLLVAKLAWGSSRSSRTRNSRPSRPPVSAKGETVSSDTEHDTAHDTAHDTEHETEHDAHPERLSIEGVPVWHMEEVRPEQQGGDQALPPTNVGRFRA